MEEQSRYVVEQVRKNLPSNLHVEASTLERLKTQALDAARQLQQQAVQTAAASARHANAVARDVASSKNAKEAGTKLWIAWRHVDSSAAFTGFARLLVCFYFLNLCWEDVEAYRENDTPEMRLVWAQYPNGPFRKPTFPWLEVVVLAPCAVAVGLGFKVPWTATALLVDMVYDSWNLILTQLAMLVFWGQKPNELVVKKLGIFGSAALVYAHSVKHRIQPNSYAGLLLKGPNKQQVMSAGKSLVLLLGRILMASLFIYVGVTQIERVIARDWVLHVQHDVTVPDAARRDGHDNNWLLLEFLLSLPFAVGWKTEVLSRLLAVTMVAESLTCWNWLATWPTWQYRSHVRSHFFTNLGVAGGLLLLQSFGAGIYSVDAILQAKKRN